MGRAPSARAVDSPVELSSFGAVYLEWIGRRGAATVPGAGKFPESFQQFVDPKSL